MLHLIEIVSQQNELQIIPCLPSLFSAHLNELEIDPHHGCLPARLICIEAHYKASHLH